MINNKLNWALQQDNKISPILSGFRSLRSTTDNLVLMNTEIQNAIHNKHHFISVLFDIKKAYDTAWRHSILRHLYTLGFRGNLPMLVRGFLSNRRIHVRIGNILSDVQQVNEGILQGSVLKGPVEYMAKSSTYNE